MLKRERYKRKRSAHFFFLAVSISSLSEGIWESAHDLVDPLPLFSQVVNKRAGLTVYQAMANKALVRIFQFIDKTHLLQIPVSVELEFPYSVYIICSVLQLKKNQYSTPWPCWKILHLLYYRNHKGYLNECAISFMGNQKFFLQPRASVNLF